jgi:general secretion pathway protein G
MDGQPGQIGHAAAAAGNAYPAAATATAAIDPPAPATRTRPARRPAFTLIEILIVVVILGIIAAIVVPQFSNASHVARENTLKDDLRYLRTQLAVYKAQHRDMAPGCLASDRNTFNVALMKSQLTSRTNADGTVGLDPRAFPFGPYLQKVPPNPLTQAEGIMPLARTEPLPKTPGGSVNADGQKTFGWIFKPDSLDIIPYSVETDGRGRPYLQY